MPDLKTIQAYIKDASQSYQSGNPDKARLTCKQLLDRSNRNPESVLLAATMSREHGDLAFSVELLKEATKVSPANPELQSELGRSLHAAGDLEGAINCTQTAINLGIDSKSAHYFNLGIMFQGLGKQHEAGASYEAAIHMDPECAMAYNNLGNIYRDLDQLDKAVSLYRQAVRFAPGLAIAHYNLGSVLGMQSCLDEAYDCYNRALSLEPDFPLAWMNMGNILKDQGRISEALDAYDKAHALDPGNIDIQNNRLYTLNFSDTLSPEEIFKEHCKFELNFPGTSKNKKADFTNSREPARTLRIGYVSPDFRDHSILFFIQPVLSNHDTNNFRIYAYYNNRVSDAGTEYLKTFVDEWRDIAGLSDESVSGLISNDEIDILVDLAGHTAHSRLPVFAQKPAPIQATWMGYPNTTGLTAIDYRIVDKYTDPAGVAEQLHSEELIRLPEIFSVYSAPNDSPSTGTPPCVKSGQITFGSFNNTAKISKAVISLWSRVLHAVPESRLILKYQGLEQRTSKDRLYSEFSALGIPQDRLSFIGRDHLRNSHLQHYSQIDIALDTYPYNGTTTTLEALWMGVPVVTLVGNRHASRVGYSILSNLGMTNCIASTGDEYVNAAEKLAGDIDELKKLRASLRTLMSNSPVMNARRFTSDLEHAYRNMWCLWCNNAAG